MLFTRFISCNKWSSIGAYYCNDLLSNYRCLRIIYAESDARRVPVPLGSRYSPVHGPGWTGEYRGLNRVPPWWTGMMPDGPGWTGGLSGGFWHVKNQPWRTGKGSPTWVNLVEPCWHRMSTGKDREGSWRCRRWPGSTGLEKNELSTPGGQRFTAVLPVPHARLE